MVHSGDGFIPSVKASSTVNPLAGESVRNTDACTGCKECFGFREPLAPRRIVPCFRKLRDRKLCHGILYHGTFLSRNLSITKPSYHETFISRNLPITEPFFLSRSFSTTKSFEQLCSFPFVTHEEKHSLFRYIQIR